MNCKAGGTEGWGLRGWSEEGVFDPSRGDGAQKRGIVIAVSVNTSDVPSLRPRFLWPVMYEARVTAPYNFITQNPDNNPSKMIFALLDFPGERTIGSKRWDNSP